MLNKRLSRDQIKWLALIFMICDHIGFAFTQEGSMAYTVLRVYLGRISYPLFCTLLVEGFFLSKHKNRHLIDLVFFAVISEPVFDRCFAGVWVSWAHQNVMYSWLLAYILMLSLDRVIYLCSDYVSGQRKLWHQGVWVLLVGIGVCGMGLAAYMNFDYGAYGTMCVIFAYGLKRFRPECPAWILCAVVSVLITISYGTYIALLAVPIMALYNSERRSRPKHPALNKYWFYAAYPAHLLVIALILVCAK